ncbi:MAG: hypothetical protein AB8G15_04855 [Saprospiraceae bacterium]
MRHILLFFFILFQFQASAEQNLNHFHSKQRLSLLQEDSLSFPQTWEGIWVGELKIHNATGLVQTLPMELHILPLDSADLYSWTIIYGEDKIKGKRDYLLVPVDPTQGHYLIDEQNSIGLDAFLLGEQFYQRFSVAGNMLLTSTALREGQLVWEIISGSLTPVQVTGNTQRGDEEIPEVSAFPIKVLQRAILLRKK